MAKVTESLMRLSVDNGGHTYDESDTAKMRNKLCLFAEKKVSQKGRYILAVCGTQSSPEFRIGAALSNYRCVVYTVGETISETAVLTHNQSPIVGIKFSPVSKNVLYTATSDGLITVCDLRAKGKVVATFKESGKARQLASFDVNCDERLIASGTEHVGGDAFILFWDIRLSKVDNKSSLLGGYWESHLEEVVSLAFHPTKQDILASGSTDGLINIFDLTQPSEDAALTYSLNTELSVDKLGWHMNDRLWCTTQMQTLQLWNCEDASPYAKFDRNGLATLQQSNYSDNCYLVNYHSSDALGKPFLLAGSYTDNSIYLVEGQLDITHNIVGNKQIVRDSFLHEKSGFLVTGGEKSIINIWKQSDINSLEQSEGHELVAKIGTGKGRDRHHRVKPY